jgi:diaminohydroxyphosphoribosylaminopyrimidine deaminase/5-amino-6-(5-phosphoribosylamino)uracil reductase
MDAIIVGIGTVLADNPQLTARPPGPRTPLRIVLDSQGRIRDDSILVQTARVTPTMIATTERMPPSKRSALETKGCEVLILPAHHERVSVLALLDELGRRRLTNLLVEGGSGIFGSFFDAAALDELHVFIAPRILGGVSAPGAVGGVGVERMSEALRTLEWRHEMLDGDVYVQGRIATPYSLAASTSSTIATVSSADIPSG